MNLKYQQKKSKRNFMSFALYYLMTADFEVQTSDAAENGFGKWEPGVQVG